LKFKKNSFRELRNSCLLNHITAQRTDVLSVSQMYSDKMMHRRWR